jgi:hypothetical protein
LNFNHPVKELLWVYWATEGGVHNFHSSYLTGRAEPQAYDPEPLQVHDEIKTLSQIRNENIVTVGGVTNVVARTPIATAKLQLNGQDRFAERGTDYFNKVQPNAHHTCIPESPGILVYSFALKPEEHQPSGTCNFSRIDNAKLMLTSRDDMFGVVKVFALNYNVLRVMSGMGGLAYSN